MEELSNGIMSNVNVLYIFMCNLITYIIIDLIENGGSKKRKLLKVWKRLISTFSAIFIGFFMLGLSEDENIVNQVFYGFFLQFLTWDYVFKSIVIRIKEKFEPESKKKKKEQDD